MANTTLTALISEFQQYGDFPFIGADAVNRLHDVIVSLTGGAVNPPLDQLGNNHTYWLARAIDFLGKKPVSTPFVAVSFLVGPTPPGSSVFSFSSQLSGWNLYSVSPNVAFLSNAAGAVVSQEVLLARTLEDANAYWTGDGITKNWLGDFTLASGLVNVTVNTPSVVNIGSVALLNVADGPVVTSIDVISSVPGSFEKPQVVSNWASF